jgi:hypothetical protein
MRTTGSHRSIHGTGGNLMKTDEFDEIAWQHGMKKRKTRWSVLDSDSKHADGSPICFYCDSSLECGLEECIWRRECT